VLASVFTLVGVIITCRKSNDKMLAKLETHQAVTDEKISELTREVRKHNNFAERMPVVESEIHHISEDVKVLQGFHRKG
jgi:uncharacterized membrane protein YecN with MAPEG domain